MKNKHKVLAITGILSLVILALVIFFSNHELTILSPKGTIAAQQRDLIYFTMFLSLIVIIPVYWMLASFSWKYRESNKKAKYAPDSDHSRLFESIWWGIPLVIITILAVVTYKTSHSLDPFKPIASNVEPIKIQVVALQWKWLFIYPEQGIASVNYVQFPENTPVDFEITSDAPMNSFWIPSLGGQVYAMSGMSTHLNLIADGEGIYRGSSANISGRGFAGMKFAAQSTSSQDFNSWVELTKSRNNTLDFNNYEDLSKPSENNQVTYYSSFQNGLYDHIIAKYMAPKDEMPNMNHMQEGY